MKSILPKYDDLDRVAEEVAIKIFMEDMKKCSKCGEVKSLAEFYKTKTSKDGLRSQCKACVKAYRKSYRKANKDEIAEKDKAYKEANKEKIKAYREANKEKMKAYYKDNKDEIAERMKAYREANKEKMAERNKAYYKDNKDEIAERKKVWREANKDKIAERTKAWQEAKRLEHIEQLKQIIEPNSDGKWIYIMQCGIYYKIGISNDPLTRVQYIENMTQAPTELIYLAKANYGRTVDTEQIIHYELSSLNVPMPYANGDHKDHVSREWFFGSLDKMVEIVGQYATISEVD